MNHNINKFIKIDSCFQSILFYFMENYQQWSDWVNYKSQTGQSSTYLHLNWYQLSIIHICTNKTSTYGMCFKFLTKNISCHIHDNESKHFLSNMLIRQMYLITQYLQKTILTLTYSLLLKVYHFSCYPVFEVHNQYTWSVWK